MEYLEVKKIMKEYALTEDYLDKITNKVSKDNKNAEIILRNNHWSEIHPHQLKQIIGWYNENIINNALYKKFIMEFRMNDKELDPIINHYTPEELIEIIKINIEKPNNDENLALKFHLNFGYRVTPTAMIFCNKKFEKEFYSKFKDELMM